jgi:hypothetical protein
LSNIKIIHPHGLKNGGQGIEEIANCNMMLPEEKEDGNATSSNNIIPQVYRSYIQHGICCDSGTSKTAYTIWQAYTKQWRVDAIGWTGMKIILTNAIVVLVVCIFSIVEHSVV